MLRTNILFGPPGTGKTTTVLDKVDAALKAGVEPDRIGYFAFTRKAAGEAIARATERFGHASSDFNWFRTLHSAAFKMLGLRRDQVMAGHHYKELGDALGSFTFEHNYNETTERPPQGGGLGDKALAVYALARAKKQGVEETWCALRGATGINLRHVKRFTNAIGEYKRANDLLDFSDFLDAESHQPLPLDLMVIDEAQDLTCQQWEFARRIGAAAKEVWIAGDDDQTVFEWAGADLRMFLSIKGNVIVLPKSYRLPAMVWMKANDIVSQIRVRRKKDWSSNGYIGAVEHLDYADQVHLKGTATWLLLTRHKYQLVQLRDICRNQGVVYQEDGVWSNQAPSVRAVVAYERLRHGEPLTGAQVDLVLRFVPGMDQMHSTSTQVSWVDVLWPFKDRPDWMAALTGIGTNEREYIRRLRRDNESLTAPGRVILSTIHGSKGGEADNVLLATDITTRVVKGRDHDPDQEHRVWYVGASRAKENLFIVKPQSHKFVEL